MKPGSNAGAKMAVHVRYTLNHRNFLLPSSVKKEQLEMIKFCISLGNVNEDGQFFVFPFSLERCHCIFSPSMVLEPLAYQRTDL